MDDNKTLGNIIPDKNSVYFKSYDSVIVDKNIDKQQIIEKIRKVYDPEIPVNIYDLGLIYNLSVDDQNNINIKMTLTTPNCPVADSMPKNVGKAVSEIEGIASVRVELVWDPQWTKDMMSEDAKLALDIF